MKEKSIKNMRQIAHLSPEEFKRFLPDFIVWHDFAHTAEKMGFECPGFNWIDDGKQGELTHIDLTVGEETKRFAFQESGKS